MFAMLGATALSMSTGPEQSLVAPAVSTHNPRDLYFFSHIHKAAGTTFVTYATDPENELFEGCGSVVTQHCWSPHTHYEPPYIIWEDDVGRSTCNFFSCESNMPYNVKYINDKLSSLGQGLHITKLMTLVREPYTHVVSQYAHCQVENTLPLGALIGDDSYTPHGALHPVSFTDFVNMAANGSFTAELCGNNPYNLQVRQLAEFTPSTAVNKGEIQGEMDLVDEAIHLNRTRELMTVALPKALAVVREAFFVAVEEYFEASMCLLHRALDGQLPSWCTCEIAQTGWPTSMGVPVFPFVSHGTHPEWINDTVKTGLNLAAAITEADMVLYAVALSRLRGELTEVGLECALITTGGTDKVVG